MTNYQSPEETNKGLAPSKWTIKIEGKSITIRDGTGWLLWSSWPDRLEEFSVKDMMRKARAAAEKHKGEAIVFMETAAS